MNVKNYNIGWQIILEILHCNVYWFTNDSIFTMYTLDGKYYKKYRTRREFKSLFDFDQPAYSLLFLVWKMKNGKRNFFFSWNACIDEPLYNGHLGTEFSGRCREMHDCCGEVRVNVWIVGRDEKPWSFSRGDRCREVAVREIRLYLNIGKYPWLF